MNIAMVCFENPATFVGGVEHHAVALTRALNRAGHNARLITRAPDDEPPPEDAWGIPVDWIQLPVPRGPLPAYHHARLMRPLFHAKLGNHLEDVDLVHSQDDAGMGALGHAPLVVTVHTDVVSEFQAAKEPFPRSLLQQAAVAWDRRRWRRYADRVDASIAVSEATAEPMRDAFGFDPIVIPNGLTPQPRQVQAKARQAVDAFETTLLYFGRLAPVKRVDRILEVLPALDDDVGLLIGGTGPDENRLRARVDALGLTDRVRFLGFVPEADKNAVLASADALVLPSEHEGQPIVLLEAIAQGTPVVVTRLGWLPEELHPYALEASADAEGTGLLEAIEAAVAMDRFEEAPVPDWDEIAQRTVDVYKDAL